jgi:hypothetical protein
MRHLASKASDSPVLITGPASTIRVPIMTDNKLNMQSFNQAELHFYIASYPDGR